jgi:hypothetical protein
MLSLRDGLLVVMVGYARGDGRGVVDNVLGAFGSPSVCASISPI